MASKRRAPSAKRVVQAWLKLGEHDAAVRRAVAAERKRVFRAVRASRHWQIHPDSLNATLRLASMRLRSGRKRAT